MKWKDKDGKEVGRKEFFSRWKQGIEGITPLQQAKMAYKSTWIILVGIVAGIIVSFFTMKQLWWLLVILVGALLNTITVQIGNYQKMKIMERLEGGENE